MAKKQTYDQYYWSQSGNKRFRLNELVIWAVCKLQDTETNVKGSFLLISGLREKLVRDIKYEGWTTASARFRSSVVHWMKSHIEPYESTLYMYPSSVSLAE